MTRYVAFLRGINVGGRVVRKERLQEAFAGLALERVETFRQSGNVFFETDDARPDAVRGRIEAALERALGYEVPAFVRTVADLEALVELEPFRGVKEEGSSFLVTMLRSAPSPFPLELPLTIPKSTARVVSAHGSDVFSVTHGGGEGALPNPFLESKLRTKATTRNMNVLRDIVERYGSEGVRSNETPRKPTHDLVLDKDPRPRRIERLASFQKKEDK